VSECDNFYTICLFILLMEFVKYNIFQQSFTCMSVLRISVRKKGKIFILLYFYDTKLIKILIYKVTI